MGLGSTAKKLQKVIDAAEQLYSKMNDVLARLGALETDVESTSKQVDRMERRLAEQRALVEALAEREGVDIEETIAAADLPERAGSGDTGGADGREDEGEAEGAPEADV